MLNPRDEVLDQFERFKVAWSMVIKAYPQAKAWLPPLDSDELLMLSPEYCASMVRKALHLIEADQEKVTKKARMKKARRRKS